MTDRRDRVLAKFNAMADAEDAREFDLPSTWEQISDLIALLLIVGSVAGVVLAAWYWIF